MKKTTVASTLLKRLLPIVLAMLLCAGCSNTTPSGSNLTTPAGPGSAAGSGGTASPAEYKPAKDMTIRVPFAAGGSSDTMVRIVAQGLQEAYGKTVYVNNLTGANGAIAAADLASVKADATEMMTGGIAMFTLTPLFNAEFSMKLDDYTIITGLNSEDQILYVCPGNTGIKSWEELVEYSKSNRIVFGSNTPGGATHMLCTALFGKAGIEAEPVTSDGSGKDLLAVAGGNVVCAIASSSVGSQYVDDGTLLPILVMSDEPYTGFEGIEVPTAKSKGFDISFKTCNFIMTSKDASQAEVDAIYQAILDFSETDTFKELAANAKWEPVLADGETVKKTIQDSAAMCKEIYDTFYAK